MKKNKMKKFKITRKMNIELIQVICFCNDLNVVNVLNTLCKKRKFVFYR